MKPIPNVKTARWTAPILVAIVLSGCSDKIKSVMILPNERPVVRITAAPIDTTEKCTPDPVRSCYSLTISWSGYDPDGRVDHYLYAVDPPSVAGSDTLWESTRENEKRLLFRSGSVVDTGRVRRPTQLARDFHVFVIKAVDDRGVEGPSVARAFFSFTQAPSVQIRNPRASAIDLRILTPSVRFVWSGDDPDGVFTDKPVKYKYLMIGQSSEFPIEVAIQNPDSLRRFYAPHFFGWDSTSADTTEVQFTNLTPNQSYVFVVVAFDEAGAYSPVFSLNNNMLRFRVGFAGSLGPKITVFNESFEVSYRGGYCACPEAEAFLEVAAGTPVTFNWFAIPPEGAEISFYRWALDIADVSDNTGRSNEDTDWSHWSAAGGEVFQARFPGFPGTVNGEPEIHRLYIEAEDNVGLRSLAIIRFQVVRATFNQSLAIIDDTRYLADKILPAVAPCVDRPKGRWPTSAELDTFLFARGGYPWKCYEVHGAPAGTVSPPGIFNGYPFDSINTRVGRTDLAVRLSRLGEYRHVVWITDATSATYRDDGSDQIDPQTSLRYMTSPGKFNTLAAYVKQGGKVWMLGGGSGYATMINFDNPQNGNTTFASDAPRELVSGRMMFDLAGWQSEFRLVTRVRPNRIRRYTGRYEFGRSPRPPAPYPYQELPSPLELKVAATDPFPPLRDNTGEYYPTQIDLEVLWKENRVVENTSDNPDSVVEVSTLDTLYDATGIGLPSVPNQNLNNVIMTHFRGAAVPHGFTFSGFNIWSFKRSQCVALVDFVLNRMWGLSRSSPAARPMAIEVARGAPVGAASRLAQPLGRSRLSRGPTVRQIMAPPSPHN